LTLFVAHGVSDVPPGLIVNREGDSLTVKYDFSVSDRITREQLEWIGHQSVIDFLDLSYSNVNEKDLIAILERVDVRGIRLTKSQLDTPVLKALGKEENIATIRIAESGIRADDLRCLRKCKKLTELWIGSEQWKVTLDVASLKEISSLRKLGIVAKSIPKDQLGTLGTLQHLTELDLFLVQVEEGTLAVLRNALPKTLVSVNPKRIGPFGWGVESN
jgi:hypothetical protein